MNCTDLTSCVGTTTRVPFQHKDHLSRAGDFHHSDKAVMRPSYLYNGNPYAGVYILKWDPVGINDVKMGHF